jgi:hypothetical protein
MVSEAIGENPSIALRSNWLTVNNNTLRADVLKNSRSEKLTVSPEELSSILLLGRRSILQGIEEFYGQQVLKNPNLSIVRPSIWTAHLGTTAQTDGRNSQVFTDLGYDNGGINTSIDEIKPEFHAHWNAIREAGFLPEVRRTSDGNNAGSWLLLRKPSLSEVLHHWFDYQDNDIENTAKSIKNDNKELEQRYLRLYRLLGEKAVDQAPDATRSRKQIGLILSMAAIKSAIGDKDGYEVEIDDALTYADNASEIDNSTVRAIENSTFEIDQ